MMEIGSKKTLSILVVVLAAVLFIPFLGSVHLFDWDEINFAECAREMLVTGEFAGVQINYQPFWEKPPLFIWMQALSMHVFGVNEFAARLPNALCGIATLLILFRIGNKLIDSRFGILWVLSYAGSLLPFMYFKSGIIDPWFNFFIFCSVYFVILYSNSPNEKSSLKYGAYSGLLIGLATLTKGPVALLIFSLCLLVFFLLGKVKNIFPIKWFLSFLLSFILMSGSWFLYIELTGKHQLIVDFINYQIRLFSTEDSGHGGFFGYHFIVLLLGCFPSSVFAVCAFRKNKEETPYIKHFTKWMKILFWVVIILFSIVKTKIVHYSSLCYFPISFLSALALHKIISGEWNLPKWAGFLFLLIGCCLSLVFTTLPLIDHIKPYVIEHELIQDQFTLDSIRPNGNWQGWEWIPGVILIIFILFIHKMKFKSAKPAYVLFTLFALFIFFSLSILVPKVETYTQKPQIEFYKSLKGKKCYVETVNYKSFANLFYPEKKQELNTSELLNHVKEKIEISMKNNEEIFSFNLYATNFVRGETIRYPAYFVVKTNHIEVFKKECPKITELYRKGGYVFLYRPAGSVK